MHGVCSTSQQGMPSRGSYRCAVKAIKGLRLCDTRHQSTSQQLCAAATSEVFHAFVARHNMLNVDGERASISTITVQMPCYASSLKNVIFSLTVKKQDFLNYVGGGLGRCCVARQVESQSSDAHSLCISACIQPM